jgi:hypothetical protein
MNFDNKKLFVVFYFVFKTFFGFRQRLNARSTSLNTQSIVGVNEKSRRQELKAQSQFTAWI